MIAAKTFLLIMCATVAAAAASIGAGLQQYLQSASLVNVTPGKQAETVSFVCELSRSGERQHWLITMRPSVQLLRKNEKSVTGIVAKFQRSLFCSTGREYRFTDVPFAMDVQMVGPFHDSQDTMAPRPKSVSVRAIGNSEYFDKGMFGTAELYERVVGRAAEVPQLSFLYRARFSPEHIASDQAKAIAAGLSVDDEREIARSVFAMDQFGMLASKVDGFSDVLETVIQLPTLFNGMYSAIDWKKLKRTSDTAGLGDLYEVPITLQTKTRLRGTISFVQPRGPLKYSAGIVGATFDESEKAPGTTFKIWLYR
jgi:hypothetical protein